METATSGSSADPPPLTDPPASDDGPRPHTDPPTSDDDNTSPQADEEDPLASLPADFAAFSLTQSRPTGDGKAEPFEQQRQCDAASDDPRHRRRRSFVTTDAVS